MNIDPNAPAYPRPPFIHQNGETEWGEPGMTIRTKIAAMAMQGYLAGDTLEHACSNDLPNWAKQAVLAADALIAELNKEPHMEDK